MEGPLTAQIIAEARKESNEDKVARIAQRRLPVVRAALLTSIASYSERWGCGFVRVADPDPRGITLNDFCDHLSDKVKQRVFDTLADELNSTASGCAEVSNFVNGGIGVEVRMDALLNRLRK